MKSLNELTTTCTAARSWRDLVEMMDGGYAPTLRPHPGKSRAQKAWNAAVVELANRIEALGWKVFRG